MYATYVHIDVLLGDGVQHALIGDYLFSIGFLLMMGPFLIELWKNRRAKVMKVKWMESDYRGKWFDKIWNMIFLYYAVMFVLLLYFKPGTEFMGKDLQVLFHSSANMMIFLAAAMIHKMIVNDIRSTGSDSIE